MYHPLLSAVKWNLTHRGGSRFPVGFFSQPTSRGWRVNAWEKEEGDRLERPSDKDKYFPFAGKRFFLRTWAFESAAMGFRKNFYRIGRTINRFGKNIIVTDNMDWSTDEIARASLDRYMVEKAFRQTKDQVSLFPVRHRADRENPAPYPDLRCRSHLPPNDRTPITARRPFSLRLNRHAADAKTPFLTLLQSDKTKTPPHDGTTERHPGLNPGRLRLPGRRRRGLTNDLSLTLCFYLLFGLF